MAKKPVKKSKVVSVQEDGTEVYGFEEKGVEFKAEKSFDSKLNGNKNDIMKHPKFHKYQGER